MTRSSYIFDLQAPTPEKPDPVVFYSGPSIRYVDAKNAGLKRYFTGKPCVHGHIAQTMVSSRNCCECLRLKRPKFARSYCSLKAAEYDRTSPKRQPRRRKLYREDRLAEIAGRPRPTKCDLCEKESTIIVFDHCHVGGHFRGWLCHGCNIALGIVEDSPTLLQKMICYLESSNAKINERETERSSYVKLRGARQELPSKRQESRSCREEQG